MKMLALPVMRKLLETSWPMGAAADRLFILDSSVYDSKLLKIVIDSFYLKLKLLPVIRQDSYLFTFQHDCHSEQGMLVF